MVRTKVCLPHHKSWLPGGRNFSGNMLIAQMVEAAASAECANNLSLSLAPTLPIPSVTSPLVPSTAVSACLEGAVHFNDLFWRAFATREAHFLCVYCSAFLCVQVYKSINVHFQPCKCVKFADCCSSRCH